MASLVSSRQVEVAILLVDPHVHGQLLFDILLDVLKGEFRLQRGLNSIVAKDHTPRHQTFLSDNRPKRLPAPKLFSGVPLLVIEQGGQGPQEQGPENAALRQAGRRWGKLGLRGDVLRSLAAPHAASARSLLRFVVGVFHRPFPR